MIELKEKGVYKITCKPTNKVYIGSTSQSFIKRFWQHEYELLKNKHKNPYLQYAFNKHGKENFNYEILEICSESILDREQFWMEKYNSTNKDIGFNINTLASGGDQFSKEVLKRRGKTFKETFNKAIEYYRMIQDNKITLEEVPQKYLKIVISKLQSIPWNKGMKMNEKHKEKLRNAERVFTNEGYSKRCAAFKKLRSSVSIWKDGVKLFTFLDARSICEESYKEDSCFNQYLDLYKSKRKYELALPNIYQACRTGKPYKGLYFKYEAASDSNV